MSINRRSSKTPARRQLSRRTRPTRPVDQLATTALLETSIEETPAATQATYTRTSSSILAQRKGYQNPATLAQDLRLLQVQTHVSLGDTEQDAISLSRTIKEYGGDVLVTSSGGILVTELKKVEALHAQADLNKVGPIANRVNKKRLQDLTAEFRPNIIAARSRAPAHAAKAAADLYRLPFVTYFHSLYDLRTRRQFKFNAVLASGDRVIVPSAYVARHVQKHYAVPQERLKLIPRGVDLYKFSATMVNNREVVGLRNSLGLFSGRPVFVMAGRMSFWKGHHLFIEAIQKLKDINPYGLIITYGDSEKDYSRDVKKLIKRWGMEDKIKIVDTPQEMKNVYSLANAVVSASIEPEGFMRSVAEAMCLGKPCIAPNHGSSPEQIIHHETGWLYPPGDVGALTQCIREAIGLGSEQRDNLAAWSSESVRAKNDLTKVCDEEIDLFLELASA